MAFRDALKAAALSLVFLAFLLGVWHVATLPKEKASAAEDEYARLMGKGARKSEGFPTPAQLGETMLKHLREPFYDRGANDKGIGIQLGYSLARVAAGYLLRCWSRSRSASSSGCRRCCTERSTRSSRC